jgi:hypothetical protein
LREASPRELALLEGDFRFAPACGHASIAEAAGSEHSDSSWSLLSIMMAVGRGMKMLACSIVIEHYAREFTSTMTIGGKYGTTAPPSYYGISEL